LMDAESGFFYSGTYLGKKKIVSLGASFDYQKDPTAGASSSTDYRAFDVDAFVDLPLGPGVLTAQVDYLNLHGGWVAGLPKAALMAEAGYTISDIKLSPIVRFEQRFANTDLMMPI